MATEDFKRKLTAILNADAVGYSRLMGDDETDTVKTLEAYKGVMYSLIKQHRGRVVDSPGDNLLAEFGSVVDAVQCAVSIQKELQARNADLSENRRMDFRIGINLGDVIEEQDRIYGDGVNIAARLEALADPGGICVSKTAFDHIESKLPLGYEFLGDQTVKNIAKPVGAYKILMETRVVGVKTNRQSKALPFWRKTAFLPIGIIVILFIVIGLYWNFNPSESTIKPEKVSNASDARETPKTIAVLPFENLSSDPEQEYFVDGLSEEILNSLTKIPDLRVTSRTSSFYFKNTDTTMQKIADVLNVSYILEGSVRKAGNALRITAQLIRVADDCHLWSESYDRELEDIFFIQEGIAKAVANELKSKLGIGDSVKQLGGTDNKEAYEYYLVAKGQIAQSWNTSMVRRALESIERAIMLDPEFALAWNLRAQGHIQLSIFGPYNLYNEEINAALQAAQRAIELEPNLGSAYVKIGHLQWSNKNDWIEAETYFHKALALFIDSLSGDDDYMVAYYNSVGKFKRARELIDLIKRYDPLHVGYRGHYMMNLAILGNTQGAEEEYERCRATFGDNAWHDQIITMSRLGSGKVLSRHEIVHSDPINIVAKEFLGSQEEGLFELRQLYSNEKDLNVQALAVWAAYYGDPEFAMDAIEKAGTVSFYTWLPVMHDFRRLQRFKEFVREIGLVDYWKKYGWPDLCHPVGDDDFVCE